MSVLEASIPGGNSQAQSAGPLGEEWEAAPPGCVELDEGQRRRLLVEVERRSLGGLFMHLPAWLLVCAANGLFATQPQLVAAVVAVFLVNTVLRVLLHRRFAALVQARHALALRLFLVLLLSGSAVWGALLVAAVYWPPLRAAQYHLLLVSLAICAAGTMTLAVMNSVRIGMPSLIFVPNVLALLASGRVDDRYVAVMSLLFLGYVFVVSRIVQRDYWVGVQANALLAERASELERLSITDALTQLSNRLHFDRMIRQEWRRARRSNELVTVLIVDLDHFKRINDTHGHPFGDTCLRAAAEALRRELYRPADLLARYGGEEFVVLLPGTDVAGSLTVAERLREAIARTTPIAPAGPVPLSCSIGAATMRSTRGADWPALLSEADAALYRAKQEGRNRVVAADRWPAGTLAATLPQG